MSDKPNNQNNQSQAHRNRDRGEAAAKALAAYFAIKNPDTLPLDADCEGYETLIDLLTDLRHWASDNCVDYDDADRLADGHFDHELHQEVGDHEPSSPKSYAKVEWCVEDIQERRPGWTVRQCEEFLDDNEDHIAERLIELGWDVIDDLLPAEVKGGDPQ